MNEDYNYYLDTNIPENERRDIAFQTVNAIRESVTLAKNTTLSISYEFAFDIIYDLDPNLYEAIVALLVGKNENELVKYYKEEADALTTDSDVITPVDLITTELERVDGIIQLKTGKATYLLKRKLELIAAKEYFTPREQSEHKSLSHDYYLKSRDGFFGKPLYETDSFKDYKISKDKILRLRLLHPDKDEAILGVDLIYEHFDLKLNRVRFAQLQYKSWNNNILYSSVGNLIDQIAKMKKNLCESGLCKAGEESSREDYRFPFCSGFLRPTSKIQQPDSKLITTGIHVPICQALTLLQTEGKITKESCKDKSIRGHIFEELFISNLTGSRWISIDQLELFYSTKGVTSNLNRIRIHAQEVDIFTDYEANKER